MIKLSSWLTVSFVVLLTVGGVGCALAAETSSAPPTQEEASLTQADLDAKKWLPNCGKLPGCSARPRKQPIEPLRHVWTC